MGVGIDWATDAWLAVEVNETSEAPTAWTDPDFGALLDTLDAAGAADGGPVLVDIPIGLVSATVPDGRGQRQAERLARNAVGPRHASVFTPPCREALDRVRAGADHADVSDVNREVTDRGLTVQAYHIAEAIAAVDDTLRDGVDSAVREAHPEVCFRAFAGEPLDHSKTTAQGFGERLAALDAVADAPETAVRSVAERLDGEDADADVDDVLDAVALAYTVDAPPDHLRTLPPDPPRDAEGLRMEMVYRAAEPLPVET